MNKITSFFSMLWAKIKLGTARTVAFAKKRKLVTGVILLVIIGVGYWGYTVMAAGSGATEYVLGTVTRAPLNVTVTASGQVDAQDTLNLTPQASGQITYIGVTPGETVKAGTLVAELDMTTAEEAVTSAKQSLESAQISYQQTLSSSGTSVTNDQTSFATAQTNDLTSLSSNYTSLASVMNGLNSALYDFSTITGYTAEKNVDAYESYVNTAQSQQYHDQVIADYTAAMASYQKSESEYSSSEPSSMDLAQIESLDADTLATDVAISTTLKDSLAYYNYVNAQLTAAKTLTPNQLASQISSLTSYQSTVTSADTSLTTAESSLINAQQSIDQDTQSLGDSSVPLNVQSAQLNVDKAQEALTEAETNESDYEVRAPFDGEIATVPVNTYDQASAGTTVATLITTEEYADLSLNETDAAKVKVGQPVSVTFDAISGFTMPGTVATIDPVGTVSAGVVTYDVKISFSSQDSRVKPGMTAEAVITTASEASAIQVPSAAIKTNGNFSTVQVATLTNASSTLASSGAGATGSTTGARRTRSATSTAAYAGFGAGAGGTGSTSSSSGAQSAFASSTYAGLSGTTAATSRSLTVPASEVTLKTVPVTLGISNDTMTEVLTGLTPGEYVVTATQSSAKTTTKTAAASATSLLGGATTGRTTGTFTGGGAGGGGTRTAAPAAATR